MRFLLAAVLVLAACGGKGSPEPAWPKSAGHVPPESWEEDGGESLEPQGDTAIESGGTGGDDEGAPVDAELQALIDEALKPATPGETPAPDEDEMIIIDEGDPPPADPDAPTPTPPSP